MHRANSFDLLRLLAAVSVLVGHACVLTGRPLADPLARWTALGSLGSLGVSVFFAVSGFLVTASFRNRRTVRAFAVSRALRILPGLGAAVTVTAVAGAAFSTLAAADYFRAPLTWLYPVRNILVFPVTYALPGVFERNPFPGAVNGNLWTLRLEVGFYAGVAVLGWRGWLTPRVLGVLALAMLAGMAGATAWAHAPLQVLLFARSGLLFFAGAFACVLREEPGWWAGAGPRRAALACLAAIVLASQVPGWGDVALAALLPVPVLVFGSTALPGAAVLTSRVGDLSYGVYLWSFPVQQALWALQPRRALTPVEMTLESLAVVTPLAWLSWRLVERPALALKPPDDRPAAGAGSPAPAAGEAVRGAR